VGRNETEVQDSEKKVMNTVLTIASREIRERSRLFIVAAALAVLPFLVALAPGVNGNRGTAVRVVGALAAVVYALAIALTSGASTIGRELTDKRLAFYFSKPVSPTALWIGKAGAALLIALVCALIVVGPSLFLSGGSFWNSAWVPDAGDSAGFLVISVVTLFLGAHALSTMTRSRSLLIVADVVLGKLAILAVVLLLRPVLMAGGSHVAAIIGGASFAGLLIILAVAPVFQLANGRTDARRSHHSFFKVVWPAVGAMILVVAAVVVWLRSPTPADVDVADVHQAPSGGWSLITGPAIHRGDMYSTFLYDSDNGQSVRLASPPWGAVRWSRDGRVAAWIEPVGFIRIREFELCTRTMGAERTEHTGIRAPGWSNFALSDDGSRVAIAGRDLVTVHDVRTSRILASAKVSDAAHAFVFFTSPDVVRVLQYDRNRQGNTLGVRSYELDVSHRKFAKLGERVLPGAYGSLALSEDGSRAFSRTTAEILDGRTLAPIARLAPTASWASGMLNDGSVVLVENAGSVVVRFFDRDSHALGSLTLPNAKAAYLTAETADGKVLFVSGGNAVRDMFVVDRNRMVLDRVVKGVKGPMPDWFVDPRLARFDRSAFVGTDANGKLTTWKAGA
jgi:hypothetical protein